MWAKASISPLFELAREAGEAEPVGAADRPHIHRPFLPIVPRREDRQTPLTLLASICCHGDGSSDELL
jgi:hypothetical protein